MELNPELLNDWYPVARSDSLADGQLKAVRLLGRDLVLWRTNGRVAAWHDLCIHRGTRLSLGRVENGQLVCPYHGWHYDETGRCAAIPAHPSQRPPEKARAGVYRSAEQYGLIWVSLGMPERDLPPFPEEHDPAYRKVLCGPSAVVQAGAPRVIENFLDVAHLSFVHIGLLGDPEHAEVNDYSVEVGPNGIVASDILIYQPDPFGTGQGHHVRYTYRVFRPFMAYLSKDADDEARFTLAVYLTPHDAVGTTAWFYMAVNARLSAPDQELIDHQTMIFAQDRPIVESQRPELLPLDLQEELHLRSDRTAIAYRRWLRELQVNFGTRD